MTVTQDTLVEARELMRRSSYPIWPADAERLIAEALSEDAARIEQLEATLARQTEALENLERNLETRDQFIVAQGLWVTFVEGIMTACSQSMGDTP